MQNMLKASETMLSIQHAKSMVNNPKICKHARTDERTGGREEGTAGGYAGERTGGRAHKRAHERTDGRTGSLQA